MLEVELSTPRSHEIDEERFQRLAGDWPVARPPLPPRPYDEGAVFELAAKARRDVMSWYSIAYYIWPVVDGDEPMGEQERRVWFAILSDRAYTCAKTSAEALDGLRERSLETAAAWSKGAAMETLRSVGVRASARDPYPFQDWLMFGALLRYELPWCDTLEVLEEHVQPGALAAFAHGLGPCPIEERARASALTRRIADALMARDFERCHVYDLLRVAPNQEVIASRIDAIVGQKSSLTQRAELSAYLWSEDLSDVKRLLATRRVVPLGRDVVRVFARWGAEGISTMMSHGLAPKKSKIAPHTLSIVEKIHAPEIIEGAFPHSAPGSEGAEIVRRYIDAAPAEHAAHGLIACCNRAGKKRTWAVEELRLLSEREGGSAAIEDALSQWKKATSDFVRAEVLDHEDTFTRAALEDIPEWAAALAAAAERFEEPLWFGPGELPPLITLEGQALPDACARGLLCRDLEEVASAASANLFDEEITARVTRDSLGELALDLMARWCAARSFAQEPTDHRRIHARPLAWLGRFPSPAAVSALEDYIRTKRMPNRRRDEPRPFRVLAAEALVAIDSVEALAATLRLEETGKREVKAIGERAVKARMKRRHLKREELCHLAVPTFGLNARGERDFDYGPRTIRMRVAADAIEYEDLSSGKTSTRPPKGKRADDVDLVAAAAAVIARTHKPLAAELKRHVRAFEEDMVLRANWKAGHWREHIVGNPLLGAMATRLVWTIKSPGGDARFARPTADGSLLDVDLDDAPWPHEDALVRIAHPLALDDALQSWSEHLASFELTQPFEQLGRAAHVYDEADHAMLVALEGKRAHLDPKILRKLMGPRAGRLVETSNYGTFTSTYELTNRLVFGLERTANKDRNAPLILRHTRYMDKVLDIHGQGARSYVKLERVLRSEALRVLRAALLQD